MYSLESECNRGTGLHKETKKQLHLLPCNSQSSTVCWSSHETRAVAWDCQNASAAKGKYSPKSKRKDPFHLRLPVRSHPKKMCSGSASLSRIMRSLEWQSDCNVQSAKLQYSKSSLAHASKCTCSRTRMPAEIRPPEVDTYIVASMLKMS